MDIELSDQYSEFIQNYNEKASCGKECQDKKELATLKQNYNNALNNLESAPLQVQSTYQAYLTFAEGTGAYQKYQQGAMEQSANTTANTYQENFNTDMNNAKNLLASYSGIYINYSNIYELNKIYKNENINLQHDVENTGSDTLTNDRKTYYETQAIDSLSGYYWALTIIYTIIVIYYTISMLTKSSDYNMKIKIMILLFLIIYPFISLWLSYKVISVYNFIINLLPKNQYKNL
jgi:hypothetical protein